MTGCDRSRSAAADYPHILAVGDSLTSGYGLRSSEAFPAQLQRLLRERHFGAAVQNAGVSGDTSASALVRLPSLLSSLTTLPDLAIVELGANDFLRGVPLRQTRANLDEIVDLLRRCGIPVLLAKMEAPRFLGAIAAACDDVYASVAARHGVPAWPFYPPGVLAVPALSLPDRLHPNADGIRAIAAHMLPAVVSALEAAEVGRMAAA